MQEKSKILILSSSYLPLIGGSELAIKNITDRLTEFEFHLVTGRFLKNHLGYEKMGNVHVYRVGYFGLAWEFFLSKIFLPLHILFKSRSLLNKNKYTLIHAYQASQAAGAGWLLKFFYPKLPFILTLQEGKRLEKQGILINFFRKLILGKTDLVTVISEYLRQYVKRIRKNVSTEVIPNGVDMKNFGRIFSYGEVAALEEKLDIKPDDKVVISVSRLVNKNGLDMLIRAAAILKDKFSDQEYKVLLVGDGEAKQELVELAKKLNIDERVIFTGSISHEELPLYLKISDVFVRPSRSEGLGSAFLEAMAAEVPIIGTKVGGIPDFLEDRRTGLFVKPEPEDIASKIHILLENDGLRKEIISNSRELIANKYDWDIVASQFRNLYNKFL